MSFEIVSLLNKVKKVLVSPSKSQILPNNAYFIDKDLIYVGKNDLGDSRYPYSYDGLTLWAYGSGYISINDSSFFLVSPTNEGKEPYLSFFGGIKNKKGTYNHYSISGCADSYLGKKEEKFVLFSSCDAKYIRKVDGVIFSLSTFVTTDKKVIFKLSAINTTNKEKEIYLSSYQNLMMMHGTYENVETKWFKDAHLKDYGCLFHGVEDISREIHLNNYATIKRVCSENFDVSTTTSNISYRGGRDNQLSTSSTLERGYFDNCKQNAGFSEFASYGDIIKGVLKPKEELKVCYVIEYSFSEEEIKNIESKSYSLEDIDNMFKEVKKSKKSLINNEFSISFDKFNDLPLDNGLFNNFLASVIKQVDYCASAKNSSTIFLGMRDDFQMNEAALLWNPKNSKKKILQSLNFVAPNGRVPRQYSVANKDGYAALDTREFIDQINWIITTVYQYIAFTGDTSILKEQCGFIDIQKGGGNVLPNKSSVKEHLVIMLNYLINNIDEKTGCLKTLYGDWNDAVDGLGRSINPNKEFGNGVSVMASLHFYKNLQEMIEILSLDNKDEEYINKLKDIKEKLKSSIGEHAIIEKDGVKKIIHGWGEDKSFLVGSFDDVDHKDRYSSTSYSFYVISKMNEEYMDMKKHILNAYEHLDSKYGYRTFDQYFDKKDASKVGRIVNLPKGTAENAATYIHASIFAIRSLFILRESRKAFDQLYKLLPITHESVSTSPFVMPNSYGYNPELGVDGESMSDWYTGSSNTIIKALVFDCLGINPKLDDTLMITPTDYLPSDKVNLSIRIKGKLIHFEYQYKNLKNTEIYINDKKIDGNLIKLNDIKEKELNIKVSL